MFPVPPNVAPLQHIYIYICFWTAAAKHLSLCCSAASISIAPRPWPMCSSSTLARATGWATQGHQSPPILANRKGEHAREEITSSERRRTVWEGEEEGGRRRKQGGPENPKARRHTARLFLKMLWCGQLCSARNRRKIFTETSCALMVSGATIHHSMLCQLCLHSYSRYYFCWCN